MPTPPIGSPPANYLDVTSFPYSRTVTQAEFNAGTYGGATNSVWFRIVNTTDQYVGTCTNTCGTFVPQSRIYRETAGALTVLRGTYNAHSYYVEVDAGTTYWIEVTNPTSSISDPSDCDFLTAIQVAAKNPTIPDEAVIINDDSSGFPGTAFLMDGTFLGFVTNVPAGETGAALPDGTLLIHDRFGDVGPAGSLALLASDGSLITSVTGASTVAIPSIAANPTHFFVAQREITTPTPIRRISATGTVTLVGEVTPTGTVAAMGVSLNGAILYWTEGESSNGIHRHDLVNDVPLSDLYTVSELATPFSGYVGLTGINQHPGDLLVLSDASIVTWYHHYSLTKDVLIHVSSTGTLLHSYTYDAGDGKQIDHLSYAPDDPAGVRIWYFLSDPGSSDDSRGRYCHLTLATGAEDSCFETDLYADGVNKVTGCTGTIFGPSASCMFVTKVFGVSGGSPGGSPGEEDGVPPVIDNSQPCVCDRDHPGPASVPDPIGPLPLPEFACEGGGTVEEYADLAPLGGCWAFGTTGLGTGGGSPGGSPEEPEPPPVLGSPGAPSGVELVA